MANANTEKTKSPGKGYVLVENIKTKKTFWVKEKYYKSNFSKDNFLRVIKKG